MPDELIDPSGRGWQRTASGLYRPAAAGGTRSGDDAVLDAARRQAGAAWAGAIIAVVALVITILAWIQQQHLNQQQVDLNKQQALLNEYARTRQEQIYSSRVSIWAEVGTAQSSVLPAGLDVHVQNRAPVPMHAVRLIAPLEPDREGYTQVGEIAPCSLVSFRLAAEGADRFRRGGEPWLGFTGLVLEFSETGRSWRLTPTGLSLGPAGAPSGQPGSRLRGAGYTTEPIGDCGEGG